MSQPPRDTTANPERERRILDAAALLFSRYGYDKTTVSDIARRAGISKGAVYLHYASKEALFEALLWREIQHYAGQWLEHFDAEPGDFSIMMLFKAMLRALHDNPFVLALMRKDTRILGSFLRRDSSLLQFKFSAGKDFFQVMQTAGAIRDDIAPDVLGYIASMLAYGLIGMDGILAPEDIPPLEQVLDGMAKLLDRALMAEGGDHKAGKVIVRQMVDGLRAQAGKPVNPGKK